MIECKFALEQERFELNTTESTTDRPSLLRRLDEHGSRVAILAHSASLSAGPAGLRPGNGLRREDDVTITSLISRERRNDVYLI